jgi:hypothetical protein
MKKLTFSIIALGTIMLSAFTKDIRQQKTISPNNGIKQAVNLSSNDFVTKHQNGNKANLSQADGGDQ